MQKSNPTGIDHPKPLKEGSKGIALIMVLAFILVVVVLANIVLVFITSQASFTHHQVGRIQAYYAAQAGMNYALEQLRAGTWTFSTCPNTDPPICTVSDSDFPTSIENQQVGIIFCPSGSTCFNTSTPCSPPLGVNYCVNATATYTYTP